MANKVYIMENLDCANCAAKIEQKIRQLPQVEDATITFATRQLRVTAPDPDALLPQMLELARTVEDEVTIVPRDQAGHAHQKGCCTHSHDHDGSCECGCGHDHEHHHGHEGGEEDHGNGHPHHDHEGREEGHDGDDSPIPLLAGAGLFAVGLLVSWLGSEWIGNLFHIAAYVVLGLEVLKTAGRNLIHGRVFDENFLMSLATLGAFAIGEFPEAVGVMLFYRIGEFFEHKAVERSRSQIMEAVDLRPEVVSRITGESVTVIPAGQAQIGDLLLVRPGDRIPLDGVVVSGESRVDTAPITGEPVPVHVAPGEQVISGCVNTFGQLTIRVERPLAESMVTRILDSVENAAASKPKIDRFITRFARIYTPVVVAVAILTALIPSLVTGDWNYWVYTALSFLVMSCPCALVLSVPLAFFSGIGVGSKQGILFKGGVSIEAMADIKAIAMDKTGTVTKGDFSVQKVQGGDSVLALCASCEQYSTHPIAVSILAAAKARDLPLVKPENLEELSGRGLRAVVDGKNVLCGNAKLMEEFSVDTTGFMPEEAGTYVLVAEDGALTGCVLIADTPKPEAGPAIARLKAMGIATAMLTGDSDSSAQAVAKGLNIDEVHARLLPGEKLDRLQDIRSRHGSVMFVGDGINDAPVLAGADVGAAMGSGADAAIEAADVVFMTSSVDAIPESLEIARRTKAIAWQNVIFALAVKLIVMVLGLCGHASMWMAVFADSGVAMLCVLNSIRLLYRKK